MKKFLSLFWMLLFLGVTQMWGANLTKTEGFETKAVSTTYNSTVTVSEEESDCGIGWTIFYGTVSTNDKISGSNSAQMRYYNSSDNRGYVQSTTAVEGLSNVAFKARVSSLDMKLTVSYSADGSAWTALATNVAFEATGAQGVKDLNYDVPDGGKYIKFEVAEGSTKPSSGNIKLIIDDVVFTYAEQGDGEPTLENGFYLVGTMNEWTPAAEYHFTGNPENPAEFMLATTLAEGQELKVVNVVNDAITAWYPAEGGNYVIDAAHAGEKTIYFQPDYKADWVDFGGYFYIAANEVEPQPAVVVLPAVLDVTNVSFRSEGMPDFVIEEGQDYAGTYFDMGAHDSSNDTLLYAEWNVTIQPIKYNVAVDVYNTNSWRVQLDLLNQADEVVKAIRYKGSSSQKGQFAIGSLDLSDLEAGDYKVRARAATAWSAMKLKDVIFAADYQGVSVELPGTLQPAYAELSSGASVANNAIAFAPSTANNEYATWNVSFAAAGNYTVTIDMTATNGHTYGVALLSADGATEIATVAEAQAWDTGIKELGAITVPEAGNYKIKLTNATQWSEAVLNSIIVAAAPAAPEYYLAGTMNEWAAAAEGYKFAANPEAEGEYMLTITLAENAEFKVRNGDTWYPSEGDNYVVDAAHAGEKTIYFRPDGQGGEGWHYGVIYVAPNEVPQPVEGDNIVYDWANNIGSTILGAAGVELSTVKINTNTNEVNSIKFGSSYVYADGKYLTIKPVEGAFKAGDTLKVAACLNNSDETKYANVDVYAVDGATRLFRTDNIINSRLVADDPAIMTYVLEADQDSLLLGRYGNTAMHVIALQVVRPAGAAPQPADPTVSVRGSMNEWGETPFELSADKTYATLTIDDIPAGDYQFKMFINGEWRSNGYTFHRGFTGAAGITGNDDNNMVFQADVRGAYTFTWTFANDSLGFIYPEAPQPQGCDWDAIDYLGDGSPEQTFGNQFKVCKEGDVPNVVNIQKPGFAAETGIYVTFPSAAFGEISLAEGQYVIDGAGMVLYLSAFTAQETEVSVVCEGNTYVFTVYNALGGAPELNYYMKNNWDAASDWTWKAMTKDGENYKLENVVFGGTGVNYNTAESDEGSSWVPVADIAGAAIAAKDTVTFVLDPAAGTVTATLIGKYVDPNPGEHTYTVAGDNATAFGTTWDPANTANDMEMNDDGIYVWEKTELTLAAGSIGFKVCEDHAWTVAYPGENYVLNIPEAGIYTIWIHFDPANGNAVTANATKTGDATVTVDYYLVGSVKGWEAKAENIFTLNAEAGEGIEEYVIETTLGVGEGLKVLSSTGVWYPDGTGNEYVVDQDHAGATTIYFRPAGNAEWAAFGGYMYVVPTSGAGIDAVDANAPAVKVLHNGQILIKKGDKTYNIMGAIVR